MIQSVQLLQKFIDQGLLGRLIFWVDLNHDQAWSKWNSWASESIQRAQSVEEINTIGGRLAVAQASMIARYLMSDEYKAALEIEAINYFEAQDALEPIGSIVNRLVHQIERKMGEAP